MFGFSARRSGRRADRVTVGLAVLALGVLLDTFLVRSVLVPALALDVGPWFWWPGNATANGSRHGADRQHDSADLTEPSGTASRELPLRT